MRLFVYGTLKSDGRAHYLLKTWNPLSLGPVLTAPSIHLYKGPGFPTIALDESIEGGVKGELYEVSEDCMDALDEYEAVAQGLFRRDDVELADGSIAVAYFYNGSISRDRFVRIEDGVY